MKKLLNSSLVTIFLVLSSSIAQADVQKIPLDKSDNRSPVLVSFSFDSPIAPAGSTVGVTLVIRDDKNETNGLYTLEMKAPSGAGTLQQNEGYSNFAGGRTLISRIIGPGYIEDTWKGKINVPSLQGTWTAYRVDFADSANNSTQFNMSADNCSNSGQYFYPSQKGAIENQGCTYSKILTVTAPVAPTPTPTPTPTPSATKAAQSATSQESTDVLLKSNAQLKSQIASLQAQVKSLIAIQNKYNKICSTKIKPKGC
jgi:hypothetical protein